MIKSNKSVKSGKVGRYKKVKKVPGLFYIITELILMYIKAWLGVSNLFDCDPITSPKPFMAVDPQKHDGMEPDQLADGDGDPPGRTPRVLVSGPRAGLGNSLTPGITIANSGSKNVWCI